MKSIIVVFLCSLLVGTSVSSAYAADQPETVSEEAPVAVSEIVTDDASPSAQKSVEYVMPYPGMLPDHPLYFLKRLRDSLMSILISDPVKKVEFSLLKSDKYLGMAVILKEKGNWDLVKTTLSDANRNFQAAVEGVSAMEQSGIIVAPAVTSTLENAAAKHLEILESLRQGASGDQDQLIKMVQNEMTEIAAGLKK